jgi:hypothetical protein
VNGASPTWVRLAEAALERQVVVRAGADTSAADGALADASAAFLTDDVADARMVRLVHSAGLEKEAARVLAVCAAVDLDRRLQHLVGHLGADPSQSRLDLDLLGRVLGPEAVAEHLSPGGRLARAGLVELAPADTYVATQVVVPTPVARALAGDQALDPELPPEVELAVRPDAAEPGTARLVVAHGADRVRRRQAAYAALPGRVFLLSPVPADDAGFRRLVRQATLLDAAVVLDATDGVPALARWWLEHADHLAWALTTPTVVDVAALPHGRHVEVAAADPAATDAEWGAVFPGTPPAARRPTAEQLLAAADLLGDDGDTDPEAVIRRVTAGVLLKHATHVVPRVGWDDLVVPAVRRQQLRSVVSRYRDRARVHDAWGLSLYPSPGVVALFSGPSGTGKTTSAEAVAHELGMDMFRVDLSALVSKYIGETEKNLEEIFSAAHAGNYVLLFDEADSLFGSRSKVEDAKDRYANMGVSYLLQRLETYDGVVVLTSNFQGNIDQAFLRRIHVTVHFTVPSAQEREQIWERSLGRAPRVDLDLPFVAEKFDLTGGSIRNAALTAAFGAAARRRVGADGAEGAEGAEGVTMVDVLRGVSAELTKLGRRPQEAHFGPWLAAVNDLDRP